MKHVYSQPMADIVCLEQNDVIATSGGINILEIGYDRNMEVDW
jgi:hypothetical protein